MDKQKTIQTKVPIQTHSIIKIVDRELEVQLNDFSMRLSVVNSGYPVLMDWHPIIPDGWGKFPQVPCQRSVVYQGVPESWAYSHHQSICKYKDGYKNRYVASWSNGFLHEDYIGQEVHYAWSDDGISWSDPQIIVHTPVESRLVRNNAGLFAANGHLYCYVCVAKDFGRDIVIPGMNVLEEQNIHLDVYETEDMQKWTHHENRVENIYLFEGPRKTLGGKLLCCGFDLANHHGMVLIWDDPSRPTDPPRVVELPSSSEGVLPEQGTWYQADDGRIWMFQRDSTISCRLALTWSDDEGNTWSDLLRTDFPNTYSRAFAGRLNDGRYYIAGNNYDRLLDRMFLLIALSDDGRLFDRQYTLIEGGTTRRINGRHKENGYHYPNCFSEGDKLLLFFQRIKKISKCVSLI